MFHPIDTWELSHSELLILVNQRGLEEAIGSSPSLRSSAVIKIPRLEGQEELTAELEKVSPFANTSKIRLCVLAWFSGKCLVAQPQLNKLCSLVLQVKAFWQVF